MDRLREWSGGHRIGFNNPVNLQLKQRGIKTLALA